MRLVLSHFESKPFVLAAALLFLTVGCDPWKLKGKHPSDAILVRNFEEHEEGFNRLIKMSEEDAHVIRVAHDFTRLETNWAWPRPESQLGFSRQRWADYRKLFRRLGLESGLSREGSSKEADIYLISSSKGMTMSGSSKGYVYSRKEITNVVESLDDAALIPAASEHGALYKRIKAGWYLCLEW
jgi:hypothetical protein